MTDLISRQAAIDAVHEEFDGCLVWDESGETTANEFERILDYLPSVEPTLYGYKIELLAYIARVMEKEGITAEDAARTFDDLARAVSWIIDEALPKMEGAIYEKMEEAIHDYNTGSI